MQNFVYKYGKPPIIPTASIRPSKNNEVIATTVPAELIATVLNENLASGEVEINTNNIDLDEITGDSTSILNLSTNNISTNSDLINILNDVSILTDVTINGSIEINGSITNINSEQVTITDNMLGIGIGTSSVDSFINGIYFPKEDIFSSYGLNVDKVGILYLPYGSFSSSSSFNVESNDTKVRFQDNKVSARFVYISSDYDFGTSKSSSNVFSNEEMDYVNSLNNYDNSISTYYLNAEMNNITLHGGNIISGVSKDLSFYLTNSSNSEVLYLTFNLDDETISTDKSITLESTTSSILNTGTIDFLNTTSSNPKFQISDENIIVNRTLKLINNNNSSVDLEFGGDGYTQETLNINNSDTGNNIISITTTDDETNNTIINTSLKINGSNFTKESTSNNTYPILTLENNIDIISDNDPIPTCKTFIRNIEIDTDTQEDIIFKEISEDDARDYIIYGSIIITNSQSDTNSSKHFFYKIEGIYTKNDSSNEPVMTNRILSNESIELASTSSDDGIYFTYTFDTSTSDDFSFTISITNNVEESLRVLTKLEIIST